MNHVFGALLPKRQKGTRDGRQVLSTPAWKKLSHW